MEGVTMGGSSKYQLLNSSSTLAGPTRREWGSINLYIGILGIHEPSFPKGQLVLENTKHFRHKNFIQVISLITFLQARDWNFIFHIFL